MAVTQSIALDAVLCVGLCVAMLFDPHGWTEAYTALLTGGMGKSVLSGIAAWARCRGTAIPEGRRNTRIIPRSDE